MPFIIPANTLASGGFEVDNSCRFDGTSAYLHKTPTNAGNRLKYTFSTWVKKSKITGEQIIFTAYASNTNHTYLRFKTTGEIRYRDVASDSTNGQLVTSAKFRDPSAWLNVVLVVDEENSTSGNRLILYVNGLRVTEFSTETMPTAATTWNSADVKMEIGVTDGGDGDDYFSGYMAETVFIDGSALAPTDFGEFDEDSGIWKPLDGLADSLTFGNNGFYLDFQDSSALGNDVSGNNTDFAANNLAAVDQSTDTCTNNFATMNPLDNFRQVTAFTEGNCKLVYTSGNRTWNTASVALSSGKWYVEILKGATEHDTIGIHYKLSAALTDRPDSDAGAWSYLGGKEYDDGGVKENGSTINYAVAPSDSGDIVGMYLDLDNNKLYFAVNGAIGKINASDSGHTGIAIPAASTLENGHYYIFGGSDNASATMTHSWNFGNPIVALSSAVSDANGFGSFEYTPSGTFDGASKDFLAICTKNLAEYG